MTVALFGTQAQTLAPDGGSYPIFMNLYGNYLMAGCILCW